MISHRGIRGFWKQLNSRFEKQAPQSSLPQLGRGGAPKGEPDRAKPQSKIAGVVLVKRTSFSDGFAAVRATVRVFVPDDKCINETDRHRNTQDDHYHCALFIHKDLKGGLHSLL